MFFRKENINSYRFILDRFLDNRKERIDAPIADTCICCHGDFQHKWSMWFLWVRHGKCKECDCEKFRNVGRMGFTERYTLEGKRHIGLRIRPSQELDILLKNNGL